MSECSDYKKDADDSQVMVVYCILYLLEIKNHFVGGGDVGGTLLLDIMQIMYLLCFLYLDI